ncbi:MAG: HzsA-related protein [Planctomycetota bacterium]|jgi:hypothetical protein
MFVRSSGWTTGYLVAALCVLQAVVTGADEGYARKDTWQETLVAWHEATDRQSERAGPLVQLPDLGQSDFTIMAWIQTFEGGTILSKSPAGGNWEPQGKTFFVRGGRLCFDIGWVDVVTSRGRVADEAWHHVALTGRDNEYTFYIDGRKSGGGSLETRSDIAGHCFKIGYTCSNFPDPSGFEGLIDELRVFSVALGREEIARHAANPGSAETFGLVGYWPLNGTPEDASGHGNHPVESTIREYAPGKIGRAAEFDGSAQVVFTASDGTGALKPVWPLLERDFGDEVSREQMEWERADGIWSRRWEGGDWRELARRYAYACRGVPQIAAEAKAIAVNAADHETVGQVRRLYYRAKRYAQLDRLLDGFNLYGLKTAIESQIAEGYPNGPAYRRQFQSIEQKVKRWQEGKAFTAVQIRKLRQDVQQLQEDVLLTDNPQVGFDEIVFVKRYTYQSSHYYTDFIDGCEKYGGSICVYNLATGGIREIVPSMRHGIFGRYDLSFDGKRIVFAWKEKEGVGFRIYEVGIDGAGLRQLTCDPPDERLRIEKYWQRGLGSWAGRPATYRHHTDDMDPCYLPDGGICFISTRCEYGTLCDGPDFFTTTVVYRMDGDGRNITKLSNSALSEAYPSVMNDGRILYTRWEYVDKGAVSTKCLWAMYPDGSKSVELYGNTIAIPSAFIQGRAIPGTSNLFVAIGGPHCCPMNGIGTVVRLDLNDNYRTEAPMTHITPYVRMVESGHGGFRHLRDGKWVVDLRGPLFIDPYPLSDNLFLVSQNLDRQWREYDAWDLYVLDESGAGVLIYDDPEFSCYQPMPLRSRIKPPALASTEEPDLAKQGLAEMIVTDIYNGLTGIRRGEVKYLRINEQVPRPWGARRRWGGDEYDQQHACITKDTHLGLKVQHGIVPVYEDGSAHFVVPADRSIFFQVLDENYMELQRERTFVNYRPGETRACVGCHERNIDAAPLGAKPPLALATPPDKPGPQPGERTGARPLHYPTDVQPILDKHCIRCHGGARPEADLDLTGTPTTHFSRSYENILARDLVPVIGENHPKWGNIHYLPPKSLGSHASKLITHLREGHNDVKLSPEEMVRLTTWVDSNGQFYGSYYGRRNTKYKDHPNFRPAPTFDEAIATLPPLPEEKR